MNKLSKPSIRKAAAVAKELGVEMRIEPDGAITYLPAEKKATAAKEVA